MKTEDLTFLEGVDAMRRGECVEDGNGLIHKLIGNELRYWESNKSWRFTYGFRQPCRIVPDPSKPKVDEGEWFWKVVDDYAVRISGTLPGDPEDRRELRSSINAALRAVADAVKAELKEESGK